MKSIQIVFGSNSGNTEMVCHFVKNQLKTAGFTVKINRGEHFLAESLTKSDLLILACSTYEHGELEDHFKATFWPRIQGFDLKEQPCAVIGLGDSKYDTDYNVESANILEDYLKTHNGVLVCSALKINKSPLPQLETKVTKWTQSLIPLI